MSQQTMQLKVLCADFISALCEEKKKEASWNQLGYMVVQQS